MPDDIPSNPVLRVADLSQRSPTAFFLRPAKSECERIAVEIAISGIKKLTFQGRLLADGKNDWLLEGQLGATVVQPCVITLDPVTTRIEQPVIRYFVANLTEDLEEEVEMPEDDNQEALKADIDLNRIMIEALALALPDYPRSENASLEQSTFAAPDVTPMTDAETKPFAGLESLKDKLGNSD